MADGIKYEIAVEMFLKNLGIDPGNGDAQPKGGGSKNGGSSSKEVVRELEKGNKAGKKSLGATLGIKFGMASLLKQSQVFTGFIGTIFQLFGALVDVILAPFLPILIPGIRLIADMVPYVAKYAQAIYDFIDRTIFAWFKGFPISDKIKEAAKSALSAILVGVVLMKVLGVWGIFKSLVGTFLLKPLWAALTHVVPRLDDIVGFFKGKGILEIAESGVKAAIRFLVKPWWDSFLIKLIDIEAFVKAPFKLLWEAIEKGAQKLIGATIDDLIQVVWTKGILAKLVEPVGRFVTAPFTGLWKAITGDVATAGDGMIARGIATLRGLPFVKTILDFPATLATNINAIGKWFTGLEFVKVIRNLPATLSAFWSGIPEMVGKLPIVGRIAEFITKKIGGFLSGAVKLAGKAAGAIKGKVGAALDFAAPKAAGVLGKLKPGMMLKAAQGFKAIPVLGAIAELGFGGWATYKDYKKYGAKAAMGRAALTLANTTTALFDPTGLASAAGSIGTNVAMDIAYKKMLDPTDTWKSQNPDIWVQVPDSSGDMKWQKVQSREQDIDKNAALGLSKEHDRYTLD